MQEDQLVPVINAPISLSAKVASYKAKKMFFKEKGFQAIILIGLLIVCSIFYSWWERDSELSKGSRFTIIEIEHKQYFDNGDPMAHFHLNYQNKIYDLGFTIDNAFNRELNEGDRLFIQFSPKNPSVFKVLDEPKVPENMIAPENGWDSMPIK